MKKNVDSRDLKKVKKMASGLVELKKVKSKHLVSRDRKILGENFKSYEQKLRRIVNIDVSLLHKNIGSFKGSKAEFQKIEKVVDEVLSELKEKSSMLAKQTKIVSEAEKRVSRKKAMIVKKMRFLKKGLKDASKKRSALK